VKPVPSVDWLDIAKTVYDLSCRMNKLEEEIRKLKRKSSPTKLTRKRNGTTANRS
jgi:hypothetical protein